MSLRKLRIPHLKTSNPGAAKLHGLLSAMHRHQLDLLDVSNLDGDLSHVHEWLLGTRVCPTITSLSNS